MINFLKKSRSAFGNLQCNSVTFGLPFLVALCYSLSLTLTIQAGAAFGTIFNVLLFALLGAGLKNQKSLFHGLAISRKEKVKLAYQTFLFWVIFILLVSALKVILWKWFTLQFTYGSMWDFLDWRDPNLVKFKLTSVYGFFISIGLEFLLFPILFIEGGKSQVTYLFKVIFMTLVPTILLNSVGYFLLQVSYGHQYSAWFSIVSLTAYPVAVLVGFTLCAAGFAVLMVVLAPKMALKFYNASLNNRVFYKVTEEAIARRKKCHKSLAVISMILLLTIITGCTIFVMTNLGREQEQIKDMKVVATQLTDDHVFGPMVMGQEVYFPTDQNVELKDKEKIGLFTFKGEDGSSLFYRMLISNFAVIDKGDPNRTYCQVEGTDFYTYIKAEAMEENYDVNTYSNLIAFDSDWIDQQAFAKEGSRVGMHDVKLSVFRQLENKYGVVNYRVRDFSEMDAYYALVGVKQPYLYQEWQSEWDYYLNNSDVLGCILVKDGDYYYGNLENKISDDLAKAIKNIFDGIEK